MRDNVNEGHGFGVAELRAHGASTALLRELDDREKADNTLDLTMFEDGEDNGFENYPTEEEE